MIGMVEALLAILAAGGAYLPLDPALPRARIARLLQSSGARPVLAEPATFDLLPPAARPLDPAATCLSPTSVTHSLQ